MAAHSSRRYCTVFGCLENSYKNPKLAFFSVPADNETRLKWFRLMSREDLIDRTHKARTARICEKHFSDRDIIKPENADAGRRRLKRNALPSLNLNNLITADKFTQTQLMMNPGRDHPATSGDGDEPEASLSADTPQKRKLTTKSRVAQKRIKIEETEENNQQDVLHELCDRFLTNDLAELVKAQTFLKSNRKRNRNSVEYKLFCLNLYCVSPQAYQLLEKTLCLPSRDTLHKCIPMSTELNYDLLDALMIQAKNMSDAGKHCTLVFGATELKTNLYYDIKNDKIIGFHEVDGIQSPSPAKYALVVLLQGIFVKWSLPVGFALIADCKYDDNGSKWIDKLVTHLFRIGFKVRAFVSDLGLDFLNDAIGRGISTDKTHFAINGHKIYCIFDAPNLIKSVRNNLLTHDFYFGNEAAAKFEHILKFYENDQKKAFKQAYKLTSSHINPSNAEKLKIRYATQLLSRSVAVGISSCVDAKVLDESARHTADFIKTMNDLFDALNSSTVRHSYTHKRAFYGNENQVLFFNNMLSFLQTLKLIKSETGRDGTTDVDFIQGLQITIKSILCLHENLKQEGYQYLLTNRLNQDTVNNLLRKMRSENCKATGFGEPTTRQFISALQKEYFAHLHQLPKDEDRTEIEEFSKFAEYLKDSKTWLNDFSQYNEQENSLREILRLDYIEMDIPEQNAFIYISAVLFKKCLMHHISCESFQPYRGVCEKVNHESDRNLLVVPPDGFVKTIEKLDQVFWNAFQNQNLNPKIGLSIYEDMKDMECTLPCPCFPKHYLCKLFIRMRIYLMLKNNNKAFRSPQNSQKCFSVGYLK